MDVLNGLSQVLDLSDEPLVFHLQKLVVREHAGVGLVGILQLHVRAFFGLLEVFLDVLGVQVVDLLRDLQ
jgi:hypothetical protein